MSIAVMILRHLELVLRVHLAVPSADLAELDEHVWAAEQAENGNVTAELLLGIAFVESRFDPTAVSRMESGKRKTGQYLATTPPANLNVGTSLYCGPLQTFADSWTSCMAMRDLVVAYAAGAAEMRQWLRDGRVRGDITVALAGHGCGNHGVTTGNCNGYPGRVLWLERRFRGGDHATSRTAVAGS